MKNWNKDLSTLGSNPKNRKAEAQQNWAKLEKWISLKKQKVVLILEGDKNKSTKKFIESLKKWSNKKIVRRVKMKHVIAPGESSYFESIISHLPKKGQLTIFENCWYQKSIETTQLGKWETTLWSQFLEKENMLQEAGYTIVKFALRNHNSDSNIFEVLKKTEHPDNPFAYFNSNGVKSEAYSLIQHLADHIPHQDLTFPHNSIPLKTLNKRAYNLRWATLEKNVIPLTSADSDFPVAPEISAAISDYSAAGIFPYGPVEGLPKFKKAASNFLKNKKQIEVAPSLILPTDGADAAMHTVAKFALQPGDEAIIFDPVDFSFQQAVEAVGGKVVRVSINKRTQTFNEKQFINAITKKTKMICLCNPHNPMGKVFSRQELLFIGSLAAKHQLWIMNDEVWSDIIYPNNQYLNIASLHPEIAERTISIYDCSKAFGLTGLRIGFITSPTKSVFNKILKISKSSNTRGVSTLGQVAASAALEKCGYWVEAFLEHLTEVRDYCVTRLNQMPGVTCNIPQGTYLLFPNVESFGLPSEEITSHLLEHAKVAVIPGSDQWFGPGAEGHIRICFSTSMELMQEAMDRMEVVLEKLFNESQLKKEEIFFRNFNPKKFKLQ